MVFRPGGDNQSALLGGNQSSKLAGFTNQKDVVRNGIPTWGRITNPTHLLETNHQN